LLHLGPRVLQEEHPDALEELVRDPPGLVSGRPMSRLTSRPLPTSSMRQNTSVGSPATIVIVTPLTIAYLSRCVNDPPS